MAVTAKYGEVQVPGVPDDEPVFILRAHDVTAMNTLVYYRRECVQLGSPAEHVHGVDGVLEAFGRWRQLHGIKVPD
jgi:hypothetical protein